MLSSAGRRSMRLLRRWLTPRQRWSLRALGYFTVFGSATGKRYRIYRRRWFDSHNIVTSAKGTNYEHYSPAVGFGTYLFDAKYERLPDGDRMLLQKLLLETNENHIWQLACKSRSGVRMKMK